MFNLSYSLLNVKMMYKSFLTLRNMRPDYLNWRVLLAGVLILVIKT